VSDEAMNIVRDIPYAYPLTAGEWEIKLLLLVLLFVYSFFKFSWSLRSILRVGGALHARLRGHGRCIPRAASRAKPEPVATSRTRA
jgi:hypothetical protein